MKITKTSFFNKAVKRDKIDKRDIENLEKELLTNPEKGDVIQGTNGLRKIRMSISGQGKRGGARVIYFFYKVNDEIFLLTVYKKSGKSDLTAEDKKVLKNLADIVKK